MASSSSGQLDRQLSRKLTRVQTMLDVPDEEGGPTADSELVPSSLASIVPILRVANEIEKENPRVAYLCRFHAFEKAHNLDPNSAGRGVKQFKTYLLHRLEKDETETKPMLARTDPREIQKYYQKYYEEHLKEGPVKRSPDEMAKHYQIASVLYDVLKAVVPDEKVEAQVQSYAREVEKKKPHFAQYNILPLQVSDDSGPPPPIMQFPGIRAAVNALRSLGQLPMPRADQTTVHVTQEPNHAHEVGQTTVLPSEKERARPVHDLLDWLGCAFGFQRGNVENQREHLILLLANIDARGKHHIEEYNLLDTNTIRHLLQKIFKNYLSWCDYLHVHTNLRLPNNAETQQLELLYIGLYLLIWGEASNVRFMPECLCYIFHNMAHELHGYVVGGVPLKEEEYFLDVVIRPIYNVLCKEVLRNKKGTASHSKWRNYDDLNEYFWSKECFKLGWPMNPNSDFFIHKESFSSKYETNGRDQVTAGRRKPKTNFVEVRTFWHVFRSFDRMWTFFILAFQAMLIIAWSPSGSLSAIIEPDVFKEVLSIFITASILNFLQAALDIILSWKAWGSMRYTQIIRYLLKFAVASAWVIILLVSYSGWVENPSGPIRYFRNWIGDWRSQSLYSFAIAIYLIPNILAAVLFFLPPLRRFMEKSNWRVIVLLMWWAQPKLYVARGMHESVCSLLRYTMFWILLLICKLAFSFYVEISPLVEPTKTIMNLGTANYQWHELFPYLQHNLGVVLTIWAPIAMVYFMDTQIWYAIFSTIFGGINGAFSHLGEIRTLGMLRSRFPAVPGEFSKKLVPSSEGVHRKSKQGNKDEIDRRNIAKFSHIWNEFINSLREEDLINNNEKDLLLVPSSSTDISVVQWPPFLLASKIPIAVDIAKDFNKKKSQSELVKKIQDDDYMHHAVIECYEMLRDILSGILRNEDDKWVVWNVCAAVENSIKNDRLLMDFKMSELPQLSTKVEKFLSLLRNAQENPDSLRTQITNVLQDTMDIILQDIMYDNSRVKRTAREEVINEQEEQKEKKQPQFSELNLDLMKDKSWMEKVTRLHILVKMKESASSVPADPDARRRMTFFANSLFMTMPNAPQIHNMTSFSVLTPYYAEDVMYSEEEINKENEDGISILFYLQKIYPDQWSNFEERKLALREELQLLREQQASRQQEYMDKYKEWMECVRQWTSYRGQTLARTVRGMMYYRHALELQYFLDTAEDREILGGVRTTRPMQQYQDEYEHSSKSSALADIKFTYVVSCQIYGQMKAKKEGRERLCYQNILALMTTNRCLRVAYIDERDETVNGKQEKVYYSVLVKGGDKWDEEVYRIKLPGKPTDIGEGKPENQNHAIIFTRGEALQTIDMNQDNYLEEAFKIRNVLAEFHRAEYGKNKPTILGLREHIFTGSVSSLAWFMSNQETSFVTIGQRVLANPLKVRFHYGHPDIFDRLFHITRGGISKASKIINLSEDIFAGYNSTMRGGNVTHHEYMQVGKGRDVGMNQISLFEAKVANGNGEQTLSRDVYRLGRRFDFYRMLSFYFTTVGFYFSSMVTVLTVYVFLYGRLYLVMSGLERSILEDPRIQQNIKPLENALASQSVFQLGLLLVLPMVMEVGLEKGFRTALGEFILMQLQLASVFFTFQLGTKAHYYGRTILHGGAKYRPTGRGFVVYHAKFADNYRMYSRSHFVKGLELLILLIVYQVYGQTYRSSTLYMFVTISIWFLVASWLFAPFAFNPSCFEWQKTVDDWTDWRKWMGNLGGIGIPTNLSWESWWEEEQAHLKTTSIRGRILEIILALRFLIYQYGIVYHLNIAGGHKTIWVYVLSWLVMITVLIVLKMVSMGRRKFGTDTQLMFRILKGLLFLGFISVITVLFVVFDLTISDVFASFLGFLPTGWCIILLGQACRPLAKKLKLWESIKELGRAYENIMGLVIFLPIAILSWFPFMSEFQTRLLFNQAFSRGLQISRILAGKKESSTLS